MNRSRLSSSRGTRSPVALLWAVLPIPWMLVARTDGHGQGAPYPQSPVITELRWAPASTIARAAEGSDNWPLTWADDGHLYTAYGDGWGFEPRLETKLSLGFARVEGGPADFRGVNIRSPSGEQTGGGRSGKKASGMLMVGGILYLWARNANGDGEESQLAWSRDHGVTWEWADWRFRELGYPTFVNFGRNYAGARGDYVYTVSHDHPSAYEPADRFVLLRAPKAHGSLTDRASWELFKEIGQDGQPVWVRDVAQRGPVFTHPGRCRRSGISYNAALGRYLWWQQNADAADTRTAGGFGVYDAPEPWGPWTAVYFTTSWDVGPGETGSFPPKWMDATGTVLYLVFSGGDSFSVRRADLTVREAPDTVPPAPPQDLQVR